MADPRIFINIIEFSIIKKDAIIITRNFPILHFELDTCGNRFYHIFLRRRNIYSEALKSDSKNISVVIAFTILVILLQKDKE